MNKAIAAIKSLHERYAQAHQAENISMLTEYIEAWNAPCYVSDAETIKTEQGNLLIPWQAAEQSEPADFKNVEQALETKIPQSVKTFFNTFWAGDLDCLWEQTPVILLQVQSEEDMRRLQENLIGHVLMKRRLKQPETIFIGVGEEEDLLITVTLDSASVGFEYVGKEQHLVVADSLPMFLQKLTPLITNK
ncbi:MAG: SecY interacting protein Syd [Idiomarinaceae bacterium HL-53]|nr:MAG: SecY interacting protein Syd [Idiomarinaceae bacterium HL-53]CUS49286.1 SecY interacting protein Syd [Idiomarinaceae bacterium HL-53]